MFKNLSTHGLGISGVESEIIELALTYKFKGVEPDLMELYHRALDRGVEYARRLVDSAEIQLGTVRIPLDWNDNDEKFQAAKANLASVAKVASELGCRRAVSLIRPACDERPYHENFEFHRKRIAEIGKLLAMHQIQLGLEFDAVAESRRDRAFEFIHTFDELAKLVADMDNVGVVINSWHLHVGGGSAADYQSLTAGQIVAVELADVPEDVAIEELGSGQRLLPAESGVVDNGALVKWLSEIEYEGPVTARPDRTQLAKASRVQIVRRIAEALENVWVAAGLSEAKVVEEVPQAAAPKAAAPQAAAPQAAAPKAETADAAGGGDATGDDVTEGANTDGEGANTDGEGESAAVETAAAEATGE